MESLTAEKRAVSPERVAVPEVLPVLSLSELVVFPGIVVPMAVTDEAMIRLVHDTLAGNKMIGCFTLKVPAPGTNAGNGERGIFKAGACCQIMKMFRVPDGSVRLLVRGMARIQLLEIMRERPYPLARVEEMPRDRRRSLRLEAATRAVADDFRRLIDLAPNLSEELKVAMYNVTDPEVLTDLIAANLNLEIEKKQEILETFDLEERMRKVSALVSRELKLQELTRKIQDRVEDELDKSQKEYYLREQIKAIRKELGEEDEVSLEIRELEAKILRTALPPKARETAQKELGRLAKMSPAAAEYTVSRSYLDWILTLPWMVSSAEEIDVAGARAVLDEDHYGLDDVKERILEYLAVRKLRQDVRGPILCLAGPPGVGKTSLGRSIARALGRPFVRVSLGGIRDEAEIRGHRRTYIGALPGRIIQKIRAAEANNPVFMLDEIDKLGSDFRGDPASALLEVLDPEQNNAFSDHYLELDFDLSKVLFITTANQVYQIPHPLRDRMEIISLAGYITPEKVAIAEKHLLPKLIADHGLPEDQVRFCGRALENVIVEYTREAGLRGLERSLAAICRKAAMRLTQGEADPVKVTEKNYPDFLGVPKYQADAVCRKPTVGLAWGLAWTPVGGEVLAIETSWMPGREHMHLTGHLGEVMKESADIALSYLRTNAARWGLSADFMVKKEIHVHVPEGATPKDGPSAGVTMAAALASLFTGRPVRGDLAMTGELTLQGRILPVGGIREKLVAARRARLKNVLLPKANQKDLEEVPQHLKEQIQFHFVDNVDEAIRIALNVKGIDRRLVPRDEKRKSVK
ncbi:MAG: endopeptidase La [Candidatus Zixiibacteriota bacterium]|nr:MAG: endopeptidase La [candidate division Zixibacteria bacterium]